MKRFKKGDIEIYDAYKGVKFRVRRIEANNILRHQDNIPIILEEENAYLEAHPDKRKVPNDIKISVPKHPRFEWEVVSPSLFTTWAITNKGFTLDGKGRTLNIVKIDFSKASDETFERIHKGFKLRNLNTRKFENFVFLFRSNGSAKNGTAYFIKESLSKEFRRFLNMGLPAMRGKGDLTSWNAYRGLIASSICDAIRIDPYRVLILEDVDYNLEKMAYVATVGKDKRLQLAKEMANIDSSLFDGEALIQYDYRNVKDHDGFVLLRQHFTKSCAFKCDIQRFYRDYYGDEYEYAHVKDCFGNEIKAKDVVLIMTKSSIKWIKFKDQFDRLNELGAYWHWHRMVSELGGLFGVVKSAHDSKFIEVDSIAECNYQIFNTLHPCYVDSLIETSKSYLEGLSEYDTLLKVLELRATDFNNLGAWVDWLKFNPALRNSEFLNSKLKKFYYDQRDLIKHGRPMFNGHYLTICGNPIALLNHSVGEEPIDGFEEEDNVIQCYCPRFEEEYLGGARSPHNSRNNLVGLHNVKLPELDKYMYTGNNVVVVNQRSDFQARTNGSDEDGDTLFTCCENSFVKDCLNAMKDDEVVVNGVKNSKVVYFDTPENQACIDCKCHRSQGDIGSSSNMSANSQIQYWNSYDLKYYYNCIAGAVIAQIAIDSSKKCFDIDMRGSLSDMRIIAGKEYPPYWGDTTGNPKKNCNLPDNKSPLYKLSKVKLPYYCQPDNILNNNVIIKKPIISYKSAERCRSFISDDLINAMKKRRFLLLSEEVTRMQNDEDYNEYNRNHEKLFGEIDEYKDCDGFTGEHGIVTLLRKKFNKWAEHNKIPYLQYIMYYIIVESDFEERDKGDLIWLVCNMDESKKYLAEALQFREGDNENEYSEDR